MQRLIFDYSPAYFVLCLALGGGYAWLLYSSKYTWSKTLNRLLFALRALLASALFILLLGPVLRQTTNFNEKPTLVFLVDNSRSVKETVDTATLIADLRRAAETLGKNDLAIEWSSLSGPSENFSFTQSNSELAAALRQTTNRYEGRNLAGVVLVSDGIYNNGVSPLFLPLRVPVYTIGVGDTVQRADLVLRNVAYNRVVYQGNKYPLRAEVGVIGLANESVTVAIRQQGTILQQQSKTVSNQNLVDFDFQLEAKSQGIQRLEVVISTNPKEQNKDNNRATAFVEVVEGKKKVLVLAASPHPDIKTLRTVMEKNPNYEFLVHIPGIQEQAIASLDPKEIDLLIAHQAPDVAARTVNLVQRFMKANVPVFFILGRQSQLRSLPAVGLPLTFENYGQRDDVQPVLNPAFPDFTFSEEVNSRVARFEPVSVPFGKFTLSTAIKPVLFQQIGSLATDRPLLFTTELEGRKVGVFLGDGLWLWRLGEFQETGKSLGFDELMSKYLQYLATQDDRRRFRSFPVQHEFSSDGPAVIESQVYNELFEPVYGNSVEIELRGEDSKISIYRYVIGPGSASRYRIGGLAEGVYRFTASTELNGKKESARGEFLVVEQNQELRNLTADFGLLRKLAEATEGRFYRGSELGALANDLSTQKLPATIHSEESFNPIINIKAVFFLLLLLVSIEWFLRKFAGSY